VNAAQISGKVLKAAVRANCLPSNPIGDAALTEDKVEGHDGCDRRLHRRREGTPGGCPTTRQRSRSTSTPHRELKATFRAVSQVAATTDAQGRALPTRGTGSARGAPLLQT